MRKFILGLKKKFNKFHRRQNRMNILYHFIVGGWVEFFKTDKVEKKKFLLHLIKPKTIVRMVRNFVRGVVIVPITILNLIYMKFFMQRTELYAVNVEGTEEYKDMVNGYN